MGDQTIADVREFIGLRDARASHQAAVKDIEARLAKLEESLVDDLTRQGVQNMTVDGKVVYIHRQGWASVRDKDRARAVRALIECGYLDEMVMPSSQRVSAYFRSFKDQQHVEEELREAFEFEERVGVRVRKA